MENFESFTINSQEEFDARISERIGRLNNRHAEATAELQNKIEALEKDNAALIEASKEKETKYADYDSLLEEKDKAIKNYETASVKARIAHEYKIPYELQKLIVGSDEEEMKASAELLSGYTKTTVVPLASSEPAGAGESADSELREFANSLFK